jgi:hypothetical protein
VAELADAQDSKSCPRKRVWVQFPPSALNLSHKSKEFLTKERFEGIRL